MVKLPTVDTVDAELFAGTLFSFDMIFWLDDAKTQPHPVQSFKCSIHADGEELLDLDSYATVDPVDNNVVHVVVPPSASTNLVTKNDATWQGVTTFVDGEIRAAFKGKLQIWGRRVD